MDARRACGSNYLQIHRVDAAQQEQPQPVMREEIASAIAAIDTSLQEAERNFNRHYYQDQDHADHERLRYYVERSFFELLVLADRLRLEATYEMAKEYYQEAKRVGFHEYETHEDEAYPKWTGRVRMIADAVASAYGVAKTTESEVEDIKQILRRAVYTICDSALFASPPTCEGDVHRRLEGILKCYYADLKSKPTLTKPIKNFEPDTGLPSVRTLIEYKFISDTSDARRVADEILADASGYRSNDWRSLLFVIYETHRVKTEEEWQNLLHTCELLQGFDAIVLSGESRGVR